LAALARCAPELVIGNQFAGAMEIKVRTLRSAATPNRSIFFTIFQTFMSGPDDQPYFDQYDADYFDFIIVDECDRLLCNSGSCRIGARPDQPASRQHGPHVLLPRDSQPREAGRRASHPAGQGSWQ